MAVVLQQVREIDDPVARNRVITQQYVSLSRRVAGRIGYQNANWLTFGSWASMSAGRFIRGEVVPVRWGRDAVAEGNLAIICDIAPRFVRFLRITDALPPKEWPAAVADDDLLTSSAVLAEAFGAYAQAGVLSQGPRTGTEATEVTRRLAQLVLRANILVAHHEQEFADPLVDAAIPLGGLAGILGTRFVAIATPDGDLDVCRDVPRPAYLCGRQWPGPLQVITDPPLRALLLAYGQHLDDTRHSDAPTWESWRERMGYISCFFRAYQQDPALFDLPEAVAE